MDEIDTLAEIFKALADPTRLRLIKLLSERVPGEVESDECGGQQAGHHAVGGLAAYAHSPPGPAGHGGAAGRLCPLLAGPGRDEPGQSYPPGDVGGEVWVGRGSFFIPIY
jgi:hypothetical protein